MSAQSGDYARARFYIDQDRWAEAERELRGYLTSEPEDQDAIRMLALCLLETNRNKEGLYEAQRAVALAPDEGWSHYMLAYAHQKLGKYKKAEEAIYEAIRRESDNADFYGMLAGLYALQSKPKQSLEAAEIGLRADPSNETCQNLRAQALSILGKTPDAIAAAKAAIAENPDSDDAHLHLGWASLRGGQREEAIRHLREALRINPNEEYAREGLLEALRVGFWPYRLLFSGYQYVHRLPAPMQYVPGIALYLVLRFSTRFLRDNRELAPILVPFIAVVAFFYLLNIVGRPLANMTLLLTPVGRLALGPRLRRETWATFGFLAATIVTGLAAWLTPLRLEAGAMLFSLGFLLMGLPNGRCSNERTQSLIVWSVAVVFGILALLATLLGLFVPPDAGS